MSLLQLDIAQAPSTSIQFRSAPLYRRRFCPQNSWQLLDGLLLRPSASLCCGWEWRSSSRGGQLQCPRIFEAARGRSKRPLTIAAARKWPLPPSNVPLCCCLAKRRTKRSIFLNFGALQLCGCVLLQLLLPWFQLICYSALIILGECMCTCSND